jgi:hypothetical protein
MDETDAHIRGEKVDIQLDPATTEPQEHNVNLTVATPLLQKIINLLTILTLLSYLVLLALDFLNIHPFEQRYSNCTSPTLARPPK